MSGGSSTASPGLDGHLLLCHPSIAPSSLSPSHTPAPFISRGPEPIQSRQELHSSGHWLVLKPNRRLAPKPPGGRGLSGLQALSCSLRSAADSLSTTDPAIPAWCRGPEEDWRQLLTPLSPPSSPREAPAALGPVKTQQPGWLAQESNHTSSGGRKSN